MSSDGEKTRYRASWSVEVEATSREEAEKKVAEALMDGRQAFDLTELGARNEPGPEEAPLGELPPGYEPIGNVRVSDVGLSTRSVGRPMTRITPELHLDLYRKGIDFFRLGDEVVTFGRSGEHYFLMPLDETSARRVLEYADPDSARIHGVIEHHRHGDFVHLFDRPVSEEQAQRIVSASGEDVSDVADFISIGELDVRHVSAADLEDEAEANEPRP